MKNTPNFNRILEFRLRFWMKNVPWLIQFFIAALQCSALDNPGNAVKSGYGCTGASSIYGTSCFFSCMMGYHAVGGSLKRTCLQNGKWSGTKLQCEGKKGMIPWIEKSHFVYFSGSGAGVVVRGLTLHSTTVAWVRFPDLAQMWIEFFDGPCSEGSSPGPPVFLTPQKPTFQIPGRPKKITYDASLLTNHLFFILAITCPPFSIQSEGLIIGPASCTNATAVLNYNSECWFSCKSGYLQGGPGIKTCNQNNDWSPLVNPSCKGLSSLPIFFQRWTQFNDLRQDILTNILQQCTHISSSVMSLE